MNESTQEQTFLTMIKAPCVSTSKKYGILPSVMAAIGIDISKFGTTNEFCITRNVYMLPADKDWYGKVYSKDTGVIYDKASDCSDGSILYRVYTDHQDSVKDFVEYIAMSRRSKDGPFRYASLFRCKEYIESVSRLLRAGFMESYLHDIGDIPYHSKIVKIIQDYALYTWDNE